VYHHYRHHHDKRETRTTGTTTVSCGMMPAPDPFPKMTSGRHHHDMINKLTDHHDQDHHHDQIIRTKRSHDKIITTMLIVNP